MTRRRQFWGCPACGCGVPCGECETCSPTPTFAPAPRVTTEQANLLARCEYDPMIQIGLAPPVSASDLAADLLDARAEIARKDEAWGAQVLATAAEKDAEIAKLKARAEADLMFYDLTLQQRDKAWAEIAALNDKYSSLLLEAHSLSANLEAWRVWASEARCIYCGEVVGTGDPDDQDALDCLKKQHVDKCPKHPIATLRARLEKVCEAASATQRAFEEQAECGDCDAKAEAMGGRVDPLCDVCMERWAVSTDALDDALAAALKGE